MTNLIGRRQQALAAALGILLTLSGSVALSAKGLTTRISITGGNLVRPIEITDPRVARQFQVWTGPGTSMNDIEGTEGFVVDWGSGAVVTRPTGLPRYEVSFYVQERRGSEQLAYRVSYEWDSSNHQGFVYLPGRTDEWFALNARSIFRGHGYEGSWFRATRTWQDTVAPFIRRNAS